jgi:hypothetical protein
MSSGNITQKQTDKMAETKIIVENAEQTFEIDVKDFKKGKKIGSGQIGSVFQSIYKGKPVAHKYLTKSLQEEELAADLLDFFK